MPWRRVASGQLGLITSAQLRETLTEGQCRALIATGALIAVHRRVYRIAGAPPTRDQARLAAVLASDTGALTHRAAAAVWGVERLAESPPELIVPVGRSTRLPGVKVHRSRDLAKSDVVVYRPYPRIVRPARTLLQLATSPSITDGDLEEIGADLLLGWPAERSRLRTTLSRMPASGRPGPARVERLFGGYLDDHRRPPHPGLERRLLSVLRGCPNLPPPVVHMILPTPMGPLELDLAWPDVRLAVEADSARWHSSPAHLRTDRARDQAVAAVGWLTLRFTWEQVRDQATYVVECILRVRAQRHASTT